MLSDGALFEPGRPTVIDGRSASFDGVRVTRLSLPSLVQSIEDRIIDFDDNDMLGQIFLNGLQVSDVVDVPQMLSQFFTFSQGGIPTGNAQTPGDPILRPQFPFILPFGNPVDRTWPLGVCQPVPNGEPVIVGFACMAPAGGSDVSPFVQDYLASLAGQGIGTAGP